jgi:hypothetical protein
MTPEPLKLGKVLSLQEKIQLIEIEIKNLKNERTDLIMENISPIATELVKRLRKNKKKFKFNYSVDTPAFDDEDCCFIIRIRFPNGYNFDERLDYKHKLTAFVFKEVNNDFIKSKIFIEGAI